ncbi:MAG: uroporphyrinogen-III synthase [Planctomycetia bacterium]|nr:uroporphyrinogen-III synthase [Planctomycetia bacterium]
MSQPRSAQLDGVRVLVTRPRHQAEDLCRQLAALGADVLVQPAIRITEPPDWTPVDAALDRLEAYDWLVFSSGNGVHFFLDRLRARHGGLDKLYAVKLAAIGPGTAAKPSPPRWSAKCRGGDCCWPGRVVAGRCWPKNLPPRAAWWTKSSCTPARTSSPTTRKFNAWRPSLPRGESTGSP